MTELEVHIISNHPKLRYFLSFWKDVIFPPPFDVLIKVLSTSEEFSSYLENGIKIEVLKQKSFPETTIMNQAWARNELLTHADSSYILFFDSFQVPDRNLIVEHLKYLKHGFAVCGQRIEYDERGNIKNDDPRNTGLLRFCSSGYFWTCNASCSLSDIQAVNGFDNRYNGGTGGEDYDLGMRIEHAARRKFLYNPNAIIHHYSHDTISSSDKKCAHNLSPYKYIPEYGHFGDWNLMESKQFEFWLRDGFKYYKCRKCGQIGLVDSLQVSLWNKKHHITRVSWGLKRSFGSLRNLEFEKE